MKEIVELRLLSEYADTLVPPDRGKRLSSGVHLIQLARTDPLLATILAFDRDLHARTGRMAFLGWDITRSYTEQEFAAAERLLVHFRRVFEPTGEDCDTEYSDADACTACGSGGRQVGALRLVSSSIPRGADFAATIGGEVIVSDRVVECLRDAGLSGGEFKPILAGKRGAKVLGGWKQWDLTGGSARSIRHDSAIASSQTRASMRRDARSADSTSAIDSRPSSRSVDQRSPTSTFSPAPTCLDGGSAF